MSNTVDLKVEGLVGILVTRGISYPAISFEFLDSTPPSDMVVTLFDYDGGDVTFTVGSGLTIEDNIVFWNLGLVEVPPKRYKGKVFTSDTVDFGAALNFNITLTVS
jgi:hypothetical protein